MRGFGRLSGNMGDNEAEPKQQSFLSKLRQRSAIIFTIGLAISVASFVENLHMGKAAIAFVVDELSKTQGLEDIVRAAAAILHGALEWWRGVLRELFSFLPFEIPQWMHDPISLAFFGISRLRIYVSSWDGQAHVRQIVWTLVPPIVFVILLTSMAITDRRYGNELVDTALLMAYLLPGIIVMALGAYWVRVKATRRARATQTDRH
jgi:hypothetical protein